MSLHFATRYDDSNAVELLLLTQFQQHVSNALVCAVYTHLELQLCVYLGRVRTAFAQRSCNIRTTFVQRQCSVRTTFSCSDSTVVARG